jgi:uncharacterized membrane protein YesL
MNARQDRNLYILRCPEGARLRASCLKVHSVMDNETTLTAQTYVQLTASALWENLPFILLGGLVFSLCCVPAFVFFVLGLLFPALISAILLMGPGWTALLALEAVILQGRPVSLATMLQAFHHVWPRSVRLSLVVALPMMALFLMLRLPAQPVVPVAAWFGLVAGASATLVVLTLALYAFPLLVLREQDVQAALRNSLLLASRHLMNTLGLAAMGVLVLFAIRYISPGVIFVLPAVCGMFIVNNCRLVLLQEEEKP